MSEGKLTVTREMIIAELTGRHWDPMPKGVNMIGLGIAHRLKIKLPDFANLPYTSPTQQLRAVLEYGKFTRLLDEMVADGTLVRRNQKEWLSTCGWHPGSAKWTYQTAEITTAREQERAAHRERAQAKERTVKAEMHADAQATEQLIEAHREEWERLRAAALSEYQEPEADA